MSAFHRPHHRPNAGQFRPGIPAHRPGPVRLLRPAPGGRPPLWCLDAKRVVDSPTRRFFWRAKAVRVVRRKPREQKETAWFAPRWLDGVGCGLLFDFPYDEVPPHFVFIG